VNVNEMNLLLTKAKAGNEIAFKRLLEEFEPMIMKTIRPFYAPGTERGDLIQEAVIGFWTAVGDYDHGVVENSHFAGFAKMVVARRVKSFVTMSNRQKHNFLNSAISLDQPVRENSFKGEAREMCLHNFLEGSPSSEELYIEKEKHNLWQQEWQAFLKEMTELELRVLKGYLQGKKYREIANDVGRTEKSVDNAICRIKQKFTRLLEHQKEQEKLRSVRSA